MEVKASDSAPLNQALAEYFASVDRRETVDVSRLIAAFPGCEDQMRRFLEEERQLNAELCKLGSPHASAMNVPERIGRFLVERPLGSGAFGVVYLANDELLKRQVAIKVPLPQVVANDENRRRFEAEAAAAARLDHPGIVAVYEADFSGPVPYIASAYCPGPDLGRWLAERERPVSWAEAALFMARLAEAVHFAHQQGVYHRDLKPSNVILLPSMPTGETNGECADVDDRLSNYTPQLTDFGLAKSVLGSDAETRSSMLLGTPLYMAPEQLESPRVAQPALADVYSLGCILYELLAGTPPITGDSYMAMLDRLRETEPTPLRQFVPQAPKDMEFIASKCLEKNPLARYTSANELAEDLHAIADHRPVRAAKPSLGVRFRYWFTRPQRILEAGWYTLCVQLLLVVWLTSSVFGAIFLGIVEGVGRNNVLFDLTMIVALVHTPMAFIGWQTVRRKRWAVPAGLSLSALNIALPMIFFALPVRLFFADIYGNIGASDYHAMVVCALMLLAELGQVILYTAALAAQRRLGAVG